MTREEFDLIAPSIPHEPGVYQYFDKNKEIIYVGKAKDLRKRIASYFSRSIKYIKTERLVFEIKEIKFTIVNSEHDALLLENNLIKENWPKYNVALKDDKSFPHLVIKKEPFPRVFITRNIIQDGSEYIGPFTSVSHLRELLDFLISSLPIRTCNLNLSDKEIAKGKYKPCLHYHIGNCNAPCAGLQSAKDYQWHINQITQIIKGKNADIERAYRKLMMHYAQKMEFEKAETIKKKIGYIKNYQRKSIVANTKIDNTEVISWISMQDQLFVNYLIVFKGNIVSSFSRLYQKQIEQEDEEVMPQILMALRTKFKSSCTQIILPKRIDFEDVGIKLVVPRAGDKKKLLDLSLKNAAYLQQEEKRKSILHIKEKTTADLENLLEQLQEDLSLPYLPSHVECFDNSNFQGSFPVAAMVCFKNGLPAKEAYRKFNIKSVVGIDDFASMREVVFRRYSRLLHEKKDLPQLIIIDGGKGQLNAAIDALQELELMGKINVVGLAKNIEELFFPGDKESLKLPYHSESLKFIRRVRDEVHRFGITFHRSKRNKGVIKNELEDIKGIGKKTATDLLRKFKSIKKIKETNEAELASFIGAAKAKIILEFYR